tara:strand:- start:1607 stop:1720 length:114 start_codon:yes stop_codon:yes gene_type:complete
MALSFGGDDREKMFVGEQEREIGCVAEKISCVEERAM